MSLAKENWEEKKSLFACNFRQHFLLHFRSSCGGECPDMTGGGKCSRLEIKQALVIILNSFQKLRATTRKCASVTTVKGSDPKDQFGNNKATVPERSDYRSEYPKSARKYTASPASKNALSSTCALATSTRQHFWRTRQN